MSRRRRVRTTAYGGRDAAFLVTGEASWTDPAQNDEAIAWGREFWAAMGKHSTGGLYLNFPGFGEEKEALVRAGYGANYERLAALKAKYDPDEPLPHEPEHRARGLALRRQRGVHLRHGAGADDPVPSSWSPRSFWKAITAASVVWPKLLSRAPTS